MLTTYEKEHIELAEKLFDRGSLLGENTELKKLDTLLGGLRSKELVIIAGASGMGKSVLGVNLLVNMAKKGHQVLYFDLENGEESSMRRVLMVWFGKNKGWFEDRNNLERTAEMLAEVGETFTYWSHEDIDDCGNDKKKRRDKIVDLIAASDAKFILIDPLQALEEYNQPQAALNEQGKIARVYKELAQAKTKTIILCHHVRKAVSGSGVWIKDIDEVEETKYRLPLLDDLKGSSKIGDYAQVVLSLVRAKDSKSKIKQSKTLLRILKNREGDTGDIVLYLNLENLRISEDEIYSRYDGGYKLFAEKGGA